MSRLVYFWVRLDELRDCLFHVSYSDISTFPSSITVAFTDLVESASASAAKSRSWTVSSLLVDLSRCLLDAKNILENPHGVSLDALRRERSRVRRRDWKIF
jgi:hypothetical protein